MLERSTSGTLADWMHVDDQYLTRVLDDEMRLSKIFHLKFGRYGSKLSGPVEESDFCISLTSVDKEMLTIILTHIHSRRHLCQVPL